jgi:hypothetical protein
MPVLSDVEKFLCEQFRQQFTCDMPTVAQCHDVMDSIVARYFRLRIHIHGKWLTGSYKDAVQHGSKTAYRRTTVK